VSDPGERVEGAAELDEQHVQVEQGLVGSVVALWDLELLVQPIPRPQRPFHPFHDRSAKHPEGVTTDGLPGGPARVHVPPGLGDELPGGESVEHAAVERQVAADMEVAAEPQKQPQGGQRRHRWYRVASDTLRSAQQERAVGHQRIHAAVGAGGCQDEFAVGHLLILRRPEGDGLVGGLAVLRYGPHAGQRPAGAGGPMDPQPIISGGGPVDL
jgi:hypothetical protein